MQFDMSSEFEARALRRLTEDTLGWLTTVAADGTPQPSPIWFLWDGETVLIYSKPDAPKVRHITANPRVSLNLMSDEHGGNVVIFTGEARIDESAPLAHQVPAYYEKYQEGVKSIGMTPEAMGQTYSRAIRFTPTKLRGH